MKTLILIFNKYIYFSLQLTTTQIIMPHTLRILTMIILG